MILRSGHYWYSITIKDCDEGASETTSTSDLSVEVKKETNYAKRQKVKNAQNESRRNSNNPPLPNKINF